MTALSGDSLPEKILKLKSDLKPWTKQWVAKVTSDPMFLGLSLVSGLKPFLATGTPGLMPEKA